MPFIGSHVVSPEDAYNSKHWRDRAKLTVYRACCTQDLVKRKTLIKVARDYYRLARYAEAIRSELDRHP